MNSKPTVFVSQETQHDFAKAEEYGEITFLTHDDLNNVKGSLHNEALIRDIRHKLRGFDPVRDWLVIAGSPYVAAVVFMILGARGFRSLRLLRWDNRSFTYVPMMIDMGGKSDD
jgi:hypothetical protein